MDPCPKGAFDRRGGIAIIRLVDLQGCRHPGIPAPVVAVRRRPYQAIEVQHVVVPGQQHYPGRRPCRGLLRRRPCRRGAGLRVGRRTGCLTSRLGLALRSGRRGHDDDNGARWPADQTPHGRAEHRCERPSVSPLADDQCVCPLTLGDLTQGCSLRAAQQAAITTQSGVPQWRTPVLPELLLNADGGEVPHRRHHAEIDRLLDVADGHHRGARLEVGGTPVDRRSTGISAIHANDDRVKRLRPSRSCSRLSYHDESVRGIAAPG